MKALLLVFCIALPLVRFAMTAVGGNVGLMYDTVKLEVE